MAVYSQLKLGQARGQQSASPSCGEKDEISCPHPYAVLYSQYPLGKESVTTLIIFLLNASSLHHDVYDPSFSVKTYLLHT